MTPETIMLEPLSRPLWRGRTNVDLLTIAAIEYAESLRRTRGSMFVITQGSYQNSVAASAGTHDGGGVVDLRWTGDDHDIWCLRKAGFAAWHRHPGQSDWPHHIHAVLGGHPLLSPSAARQWDDYVRGRNGLASNGPDDGPRFNPIPMFNPEAPEPPSEEDDDMKLTDPLNANDPKGNPTTANVTVGEALSAFVIFVRQGQDAAAKYLDRAGESPANKE